MTTKQKKTGLGTIIRDVIAAQEPAFTVIKGAVKGKKSAERIVGKPVGRMASDNLIKGVVKGGVVRQPPIVQEADATANERFVRIKAKGSARPEAIDLNKVLKPVSGKKIAEIAKRQFGMDEKEELSF